ncbi:hypothetical protein Lal_00040037 [Lupinus albus]|nr:hypothetical protein Lal_00040037 [Lupinus albus]
MLENSQLHENVVSKLQHILHLHNPFVASSSKSVLLTKYNIIFQLLHNNNPCNKSNGDLRNCRIL